jgi:oligopeptide transport system substrate-binding protein
MHRSNLPSLLPHRWRIVPLCLALLLVLAGCWPFTSSGTTPPPPQSTPQAAGTTTPGGSGANLTPLPRTSDALNIAGDAKDPPSLDPALANDTYSQLIIRQLYSGLVAFDDNLRIVPDVAAALPSVSPDGKTYTFVLRKGVQFTDGQPVTSADFKYSMERATDPKLAGSQPASQLPAALYLGDIVGVKEKLDGKAAEISGVQAPDPYTLVINIDAPKAYFLSKLTAGPAYVVQGSNVKEGPTWTEKPRGSGPFKLEKWVHNQEIVLAANPEYFGGAPKLPRINIWMGANSTGALQQYEVGGLDVADVPVDDIERVSDRNNPMSQQLQTVSELSVTYLAFNLKQRPFEDPKIREALSLAIDRQKIARVMFQSRVRQAQGFVPPDMPGYGPPNGPETYNVTKARALLAESTYKDPKNLPKLRLYTSGDILGPMLKDVFSQTLGIDVEVYEVEWTDFLAGLDRGDYPMFTFSWIADFPDPENFLGSLFASSSGANNLGYHNSAVDDALATADVEPDPAKRMAEYAQIEQRILQDHPAVPLYHSVSYTLVKPYVKGLKVTPMGLLNLKDVRLGAR